MFLFKAILHEHCYVVEFIQAGIALYQGRNRIAKVSLILTIFFLSSTPFSASSSYQLLLSFMY